MYQSLVSNFSDVVTAQLFGHFHTEQFRADTYWNAPPLFLTAAVSPVYNTNPSFRIVTYDRATSVHRDYCVYSAPMVFPLVFNMTHCALPYFGLPDLSTTSLSRAAMAMTSSCDALQPFLNVLAEGFPMACDSLINWRCLLTTLAYSNFSSCVLSLVPPPPPPAPSGIHPRISVVGYAVGIPVTVIALIIMFSVLHWQRHSGGYRLVTDVHDGSAEVAEPAASTDEKV